MAEKTEKTKGEPETMSALRIRDFRHFWMSQILSLSGTWMQHVAIGWLVYDMTSSPFYLGLTMTMLSAPIMIFSLFGGIFADRHSKRNILIGTQALSMVPAVVFGIMSNMQILQLWHVLILVTMIGTLGAFDIPARQAFFVEMVGKGNLLNAIALNSAAFNGARIVGPLLAGLIIARINLEACFYINAVSFLPSICVMYTIRNRGVGNVTGRSSIMKELVEGLSFIRNQKDILFIFVTISMLSLFGIPYSSFLPVIAEDVLKTGAEGLGRLGGASGAGAFIAAMVIAVKGQIERRVIYMSYAILSASLSILLLTFSSGEWFSLFVLLFTGFGIVSFLANANNFIQQNVPDEIRGRVMSAYILVFLGMSPLGNMIIGTIADHIGTMNALRISATICIATALCFVKNRRYIE